MKSTRPPKKLSRPIDRSTNQRRESHMKKLTLTAAAALLAAMMTYQPSFAQERGVPAPRAEGGAAAQPGAPAQPAAGREARDRTSPDQADQNMDQHFAREAAQTSLFEIQVAQLAEQRAQSQDVKQFAQTIVQDHQQANQKLQQIAQSKGIDIPKELDEIHQAKLQKMQKLQGKHFEKQFVYGMLAGHVIAVLEFRDASQDLQDKDLKQFAAQTLPKLQQHLQTAQRLAGWNEAMPASATEHGTGAHQTPGATPADHGTTPGDRTGTPGSDRTRDRTSTPGSTGGAGTSGTDRSGTNR
jgi:putative membrane protein